MSDPSAYWLTFTNIALGVVVVVSGGAVVSGVLQEVAVRRRKRAELSRLDREVANLVASYDEHTPGVPGLGATVADGGKELKEKDKL